MTELFVRLFVETSPEDGRTVGEAICASLAAVTRRASLVTARTYWKLPAYQELCIMLTVTGDAQEALERVTSHLGTGWTRRADEAVWNPGEHATFIETCVRWAHVERTT